MQRRVVFTVLMLFWLLAPVAPAQVDPNAATQTDTAPTTQPSGTPATSASETDPAFAEPGGGTERTGRNSGWTGLALSVEALLLPVVAGVLAAILAFGLHLLLVKHDVDGWPHTSGSWWKLRLPPLILALAMSAAGYVAFVYGLSEESLRGVNVTAGVTTVLFMGAVLVVAFLPRSKGGRQ